MSFIDAVRLTKVIGIKWDGEMKNAYQILISKAQN
jgi:hypothetical protein